MRLKARENLRMLGESFHVLVRFDLSDNLSHAAREILPDGFPRLVGHLDHDLDEADTDHSELARRSNGDIDDTAANERATIIDPALDRAAAIGDGQLGPKSRRPVRAGHGVLVVAFAARGWPTVVFAAVE